MVLQSKRVSNTENAPPSLFPTVPFTSHPYALPHAGLRGKSLGSRLRSSIRDPTRAKRAARAARSSKHLVENAKRIGRGTGKGVLGKQPPATLEFDITSVAAPPECADVEMGEAEPVQSARTTKRYQLPRELRRPAFQEVSAETLLRFEPELADENSTLPDIEYIRDAMEEVGPGLLRAAVSVTAEPPKDALPAQITITLTDKGSSYPPPTHMLAIYGRPAPPPAAPAGAAGPSSSPRRQVTLVPTHSVVLALHCARLPPFTVHASAPVYTQADYTQVSLPVQPLQLPAPGSFAPLSTFLYTKNPAHLLKSLLPAPPPPSAPLDVDADAVARRTFAARLAATYTAQALLHHTLRVHGLWQNACALGVAAD